MPIQILPSDVVDQIAAGEVVDRPAHMVKELVENSLDAAATEISIDFSQGGRFVKVSDNGTGMSSEDLPKSFLRFATSKIEKSEDLWNLSSFGFRGEALASISSVSKVTVFTSQDQSGQGFRMTSTFGKLSSLERVSRSRGSTIIVEELFQNVPARLKFMKGDAAESGQIKQVLKALALANPKVEFRILQDSKLLYYWPASASAKDRVEKVLEISPLYEGEAVRGRVKAKAYFSDPHQVSRVSKGLWFFAQNRYVQDRSLQAAVMEAYRNLLMHGEYPYAVCFLETDPSDIDVNIHPTKSQVKFVSPQEAFRAVQASIRDVLEKAPWLYANPETSIGIAYQDQTPKKEMVSSPINLEFSDEAFKTTQFKTKQEKIIQALDSKENGDNFFKNDPVNSNSILKLTPLETIGRLRGLSFVESDQFKQVNQVLPIETEPTNKLFSDGIKNTIPSQSPLIRHWSLLQVIGQASLTYLVCQSEKGLILIDQHAAHERVAFERLMAAWKGGRIEIQNFLFPLAVDLSEEKLEIIYSRKSEFARLGLELEELGPTTLGIKSAPAMIKDRVLVEEIERMAQQMLDWGDSDLMEKSIGDICARMARI